MVDTGARHNYIWKYRPTRIRQYNPCVRTLRRPVPDSPRRCPDSLLEGGLTLFCLQLRAPAGYARAYTRCSQHCSPLWKKRASRPRWLLFGNLRTLVWRSGSCWLRGPSRPPPRHSPFTPKGKPPKNPGQGVGRRGGWRNPLVVILSVARSISLSHVIPGALPSNCDPAALIPTAKHLRMSNDALALLRMSLVEIHSADDLQPPGSLRPPASLRPVRCPCRRPSSLSRVASGAPLWIVPRRLRRSDTASGNSLDENLQRRGPQEISTSLSKLCGTLSHAVAATLQLPVRRRNSRRTPAQQPGAAWSSNPPSTGRLCFLFRDVPGTPLRNVPRRLHRSDVAASRARLPETTQERGPGYEGSLRSPVHWLTQTWPLDSCFPSLASLRGDLDVRNTSRARDFSQSSNGPSRLTTPLFGAPLSGVWRSCDGIRPRTPSVATPHSAILRRCSPSNSLRRSSATLRTPGASTLLRWCRTPEDAARQQHNCMDPWPSLRAAHPPMVWSVCSRTSLRLRRSRTLHHQNSDAPSIAS